MVTWVEGVARFRGVREVRDGLRMALGIAASFAKPPGDASTTGRTPTSSYVACRTPERGNSMARCAPPAVLAVVMCLVTACDLAQAVGFGDADVTVTVAFDPNLYDPTRNPIARLAPRSIGDFWSQDLTTDRLKFSVSLRGETGPDKSVYFDVLRPSLETAVFESVDPGEYRLSFLWAEIVLPHHIRMDAPLPSGPDDFSFLLIVSGDQSIPIEIVRVGNGPCVPGAGCFPECHPQIPGC